MVKRDPRYMKIKAKIIDTINKGKILDDGRLPSEDELASIYNVSRTTVRSALQALEADGIVIKKHGSGNFVRLHGRNPSWNARFSLLFFDDTAMPEFSKHRVRKIIVSEYVARKLNVVPGIDALEILKLMQNNGKDAICMIEVFPFQFIKKIPAEEEIPDSIYDFTKSFCGKEVKEISSEITAIPGSESPFKDIINPVLKFEDIFIDNNNKPFAYSDYYMNIENVRPHLFRNRPPLSWKIL